MSPTGISLKYEHLQKFQMEELIDCRYYYGSLPEKEAAEILRTKEYGTYLIRDGPMESNTPLILSLKTREVHHCKIVSDLKNTSLKIHFNDPNVRPKKIPTLPLTLSYGLFESYSPESCLNSSIIGGLLPTIYKFNSALTYPLRRHVTLSLKDLARKQVLKSVENDTKQIGKLGLPKTLAKYVTDWKTCDQDLHRFP